MEIILTNSGFFTRKQILKFMMKTFIFLCCLSVFSLTPVDVISQNSKIKIEADKTLTVDEVFYLIMNQTDYKFIYEEDIFKDFPKVQVRKGTISTSKLLNESLSNGNLNVVLTKDNTILIKEANSQQQQQVSGKVTDEKGMPVAGATVLIKGTTKGTATDFDGSYAITVPNPENVLVFSALGFASQEITVGSQSVINVTFIEESTQLGEIVLNAGYYETSQRETTGSIAKLDAKAIEKQPVSNPIAAMQGYLSGVNITQSTGVPGGGYEIEIRGQNFINGITDPLFIVDGVPFSSQSLGSNDVSRQIHNGGISPLNAFNPNDIESIEVLKDADATAIYGSRGANGVVLISTKKGKEGKTRFQANLSSTLGQVSNFLDLMNTEQYLEIRREGVANDGYASFLENPAFDSFWPDIKLWDNSHYTDWQKELIGGTAYKHNGQLSVSGGNAQTQFLISGAYQKETTVFPGNANYKKATVNSNINHQSSDNRFRIILSTIYSNEKHKLPRTDLTNQAYTLAPNAPELYDEEGNLNWENNTWDNPLASLEEEYHSKINTLLANAVVSYKVLPNLEIKSSLGFNTYRLDSYRILPSTARNPRFNSTPQNYSSITTNNSDRQSWIVEPQLNWKKEWRNIKLDILIGTTFQNEIAQQFVQRGRGFPSNDLINNLAAAETLEVLQDTDSEYNYQAFFGRLNLNLYGKYILNITGRRDGSSRFGPGKQFGNFGAAGFAWLFSEEDIFTDSSIISFGKLRASYGTTGSDNIGDYRFLDTYTVTGDDYDGTTILEPTGIFNPLFAWEENKKLEVGLELGFLNDRILLNTGWYQNRSSNQLVGIPLAATTGFSELTGNFDATVENTGFEVDLRTINIQKGDFRWTTTFNISVPKNKLVKFDGLETSTFADQYIIGKPLTIVKLYNALGVDPETGAYQFEDYNDDGVISRPEDNQWVEDRAPKFYGGLGNTLSYKNLSLDFFFQFKKQKAYNELRFQAVPGYPRNATTSLLDRWQQPGDTNPIQMATAGLNIGGVDSNGLQGTSNAAFTDASFIRLRNISLNYKVPDLNNGLDINVYLQGQNLVTFTNYTGPDPEQPLSNRLPQLRQITLGLQLGF
ncbi:SusC/RagA family TonB-linked outer membrane protein [Flavivirga sp. 57AJ16]|uniref:SusC/RagA family TonB-linked outer membrane protein n=1 Tax=Flavivirga sp. 57AJ16 TaxID=3025307 RepID=UPI002366959A|nr:SusC/RagA family TonB-linked outer membrane protein [Flavivirga sp. 57AJ16]MDD7888231.1 SusC/RagA family TonB-linked outer membrane protein [Flavivirga sp. 57AJ16]